MKRYVLHRLVVKQHFTIVYVIKHSNFRPSATELLKNQFFKKAKDKKYLQQTLIAIGPSLETRVLKVNINLSKFAEYFLH